MKKKLRYLNEEDVDEDSDSSLIQEANGELWKLILLNQKHVAKLVSECVMLFDENICMEDETFVHDENENAEEEGDAEDGEEAQAKAM